MDKVDLERRLNGPLMVLLTLIRWLKLLRFRLWCWLVMSKSLRISNQWSNGRDEQELEDKQSMEQRAQLAARSRAFSD